MELTHLCVPTLRALYVLDHPQFALYGEQRTEHERLTVFHYPEAVPPPKW